MERTTHRSAQEQIARAKLALESLEAALRDSDSPNKRLRRIEECESAFRKLTRELDVCRIEIGKAPPTKGLTALQQEILLTAARSERPRKTISVHPMLGPKEKIVKVCRREVADKTGVADVEDLERRGLVYLSGLGRADVGEYTFTETGLDLAQRLVSEQERTIQP